MSEFTEKQKIWKKDSEKQEIWREGFNKGWNLAMEHIKAYGDEHDEICPLCGEDGEVVLYHDRQSTEHLAEREDAHLEMDYEDRFSVEET